MAGFIAGGGWACPACTFLNESVAAECSMCGTRKPKANPWDVLQGIAAQLDSIEQQSAAAAADDGDGPDRRRRLEEQITQQMIKLDCLENAEDGFRAARRVQIKRAETISQRLQAPRPGAGADGGAAAAAVAQAAEAKGQDQGVIVPAEQAPLDDVVAAAAAIALQPAVAAGGHDDDDDEVKRRESTGAAVLIGAAAGAEGKGYGAAAVEAGVPPAAEAVVAAGVGLAGGLAAAVPAAAPAAPPGADGAPPADDPAAAMAKQMKELGNEFFRAQQWQDALRCYQVALEHDSTIAAVWLNVAMVQLKLELWEEAATSATRGIAASGPQGSAKGFFRRAAALERLGRHAEALGDYDKALQLSPGDVHVAECASACQALVDAQKRN